LATVTRALPLDSASVRFDVGVTLASQAESLLAVLQYQTAQGVTLFSGQVVIEASVNQATPNTPSVPLSYTGPGANIAALSLSPLDSILSAGDSLEFLASAIDSNQQPVPSFYASWSTSDSRVTINALGLVRAPDITKVVDVTAVTPNGTFAQTTPSTPSVLLSYTGPGGNIAALSLSPLDSILTAGDSLEFLASAIDSNQQPVPSFYASWSTSDSRVTINALGLVRAPDITKIVDVTAVTPNGTFAQTTLTILGSFALGISPDSVEKLPGGQQQFVVAVGPRGANYTWSVNGIDGGNATFGFIDTAGFYVAPSTIPTPSTFQVCARVTAAPTLQNGCAVVVISAVPSAGGDVIVINDQNIFDLSPMQPDSFPGNARMVRNLVNFQSPGIRNNGRVVYYDRGRNAPCFLNAECGDVEKARLDSIISAQGYQIVKFDTLTAFNSIPSNVKILVLWMPLISYSSTEINAFKSFASQGGRIIFIGERQGFYTLPGIAIENQFLADMGAQLTNIGLEWDCGYVTIPPGSIRPHQITTGVNSVRIACASEMQLGPNDAPLFFDTSNTHLLAGVAKIDFTPLPVGTARMLRGMPAAGERGKQ
jgi:hypothetical protein